MMTRLLNLSLKQARRLVIAIVGSTIILLGLIFIPLPGPGLLGVVAGLAILATEFIWARRLLKAIKGKGRDIRASITGTPRSDKDAPPSKQPIEKGAETSGKK